MGSTAYRGKAKAVQATPNSEEANYDNFFLEFDPFYDIPVSLVYVVPGINFPLEANFFSQFSITADAPTAPIPEPDGWLVFLTAIAGLGAVLSNRRRLNQSFATVFPAL